MFTHSIDYSSSVSFVVSVQNCKECTLYKNSYHRSLIWQFPIFQFWSGTQKLISKNSILYIDKYIHICGKLQSAQNGCIHISYLHYKLTIFITCVYLQESLTTWQSVGHQQDPLTIYQPVILSHVHTPFTKVELVGQLQVLETFCAFYPQAQAPLFTKAPMVKHQHMLLFIIQLLIKLQMHSLFIICEQIGHVQVFPTIEEYFGHMHAFPEIYALIFTQIHVPLTKLAPAGQLHVFDMFNPFTPQEQALLITNAPRVEQAHYPFRIVQPPISLQQKGFLQTNFCARQKLFMRGKRELMSFYNCEQNQYFIFTLHCSQVQIIICSQ
ncbi:Hypothetical_protein [Hexamita inflata]|uniref:Hypothetical_protein n=1 Tax=Hexamita inflata TaxID=28002 RepID=A0AA86QKB1_9EUKA|nr:Hypothetical protein HINF_LOCUS42907 [Hexamita inflata]